MKEFATDSQVEKEIIKAKDELQKIMRNKTLEEETIRGRNEHDSDAECNKMRKYLEKIRIRGKINMIVKMNALKWEKY